GSSVGIEDESDSFGVGRNLFQQLNPFAPNRILKIGKAGDVLAGTCQTGGKAAANRVADEREYDRYGARFLLQNPCHLIRTGHHDVGRHGDQLFCKGLSLVGITASPTIVDPDIASSDPAQVWEALQQRCDIALSWRIPLGVSHEHADAPHPLGLLRPPRERPCSRRTAEQCDEVAPFQSITSTFMMILEWLASAGSKDMKSVKERDLFRTR